jgi:hypothetical protein
VESGKVILDIVKLWAWNILVSDIWWITYHYIHFGHFGGQKVGYADVRICRVKSHLREPLSASLYLFLYDVVPIYALYEGRLYVKTELTGRLYQASGYFYNKFTFSARRFKYNGV